MSPVSWRRHSCLLGRDSGLLISWNWVEPGGGARLQPAADFSPPSAGLTSLAGGRAEARGPLWGRLKSAGDLRSPETHLDPLRERHPSCRSAEKSLGAADTSVCATSWLRSIPPTIRNPRPTSGVRKVRGDLRSSGIVPALPVSLTRLVVIWVQHGAAPCGRCRCGSACRRRRFCGRRGMHGRWRKVACLRWR